jgi:hypothetical protein
MATRAVFRGLVLLAAGLLLLLIQVPAAHSSHTDFSYQLDYFEVDGNVASGFESDTFDDGVLSPWVTYGFGTASEADGSVFLQSPGLHDARMTSMYPGLMMDRSDIFSPSQFSVTNGAGDFEATSVWGTGLVGTNGYELMQLVSLVNGGSEQIGIGMSFANLDTDITDLIGGFPGYSIGWFSVLASMGPDARVLSWDVAGVQIQATDLVGDLYFRFAFDDSTDLALIRE